MADRDTSPQAMQFAGAQVRQTARRTRAAMELSQDVFELPRDDGFRRPRSGAVGRNRLTAGRLAQIAIVLGVPIDVLFDPGPAVPPTRAKAWEACLGDDSVLRLIALWPRLDPEIKARIMSLAEPAMPIGDRDADPPNAVG